MSNIFISYARPTAKQAQAVAQALRAKGYGVWRDDELPAHRSYSEVIEERLRTARAVVVLWSAEAAKSQWVRAEAEVARQAGTLVQLSLDGTEPPLPFNQIQCADLAGWAGEADAPGWRKILASLAELTGGTTAGERPAARPGPAKNSICVLPFANMSGDLEQEYFSDGVTEDIITDLSKVSALSVTSRNSAFQFKGKHVDLRQVARQLEVSHVLEGSVRKAGGRVRITAQLIEADKDSHIWAERYDRDLTDIFALQDEISQAIVGALKLRLLPEEKQAIERRGTTSPEAYNLYLMARQYWVNGNNGDLRGDEAILRLCRRATDIDPGYARAWALMAESQMSLRFNHERLGDDGRAAAERALALDPDLAAAHAVKARHLAEEGRHEEAFEEIAIALGLEPDSYEANREAGRLSFTQGRHEDAIRHYERAAALMETSFGESGMLITCYSAVGDGEGLRRAARMTLTRAEKVLAHDQSNGLAMAFGASALAALGEAERAREWIDRALLIDPDNLIMRYNLACALCIELHDHEGALDLLTGILSEASAGFLNHARIDPDLDALRDYPRYKAMVAAAEARLAGAKSRTDDGPPGPA